MDFFFSVGIKESGGVSYARWLKPVSIIRGQQYKLGMIITDFNYRGFLITPFTIRLRLRNQDNSVLELLATPIDNSKGEVEFDLAAAESELLKVGAGMAMELELMITATPTKKSFHSILGQLVVTDKPTF